MTNITITGIGQTKVGEHWDRSLRELAHYALEAAMRDAGGLRPEALYVGNMLAPALSQQNHLGALIADFCGLRGIEAVTVEAAGASGGAALRQAYLAVASGMVNAAAVVGVEKMTDKVGSDVDAAVAASADSDWEAVQGLTEPGLAALLMRRYMHEHGVQQPDFAGFSENAHANASTNPNAMFRNVLRPGAFAKAPMIAEPVNMFDSAPAADGAAALILTRADHSDNSGHFDHPRVRILASTAATDAFALHDRADLLTLSAAQASARRAYQQAGLGPDDLDLFELHDGYTVLAALSLEAAGFADRGQGWKLARNRQITLDGRLPISTFGGLKARGNPGGATGVYQAVEMVTQLRGQAGPNQVEAARRGLIQCLGGNGATAVTHILERMGEV